MKQPSLHELLLRRASTAGAGADADPSVSSPTAPLEVYDLFAGAGGFSCGAALAGCRVVFACDVNEAALETHARNHPDATHLCAELPAALPLPTARDADRPFHLHGSPPCQQFSNVNTTKRSTEAREGAIDLVEWYLELALNSHATSWSMEQVATHGLVAIVERVRKRHPRRMAYHVFDLARLGVPQSRTRLIAGTPALVARLVRLCGDERVRAVRDVVDTGRATHLRLSKNWEVQRLRHIRKPGQPKYVYHAPPLTANSNRVRPVSQPAPTVTCSGDLRWVFWDAQGAVHQKRMRVAHAAALQTFPPSYLWPEGVNVAFRQIGNALPPLAAELLLRGGGGAGTPRALAYERPAIEAL